MAGFELSARSIGLTSEDLDLRTWRAVIAEFVERLDSELRLRRIQQMG